MKVIAYNIDYDTDGFDTDLPTEVVVDVPSDIHIEEIDEYVSDFISDETGYCHKGFKLK